MGRPYRTFEREERRETAKVKGSRFIATGFPFSGEEALAERLGELREEFPDANHHGFAWRDGDRFRYGDDGEPSGSAGLPILRQLDGAGLDRSAIVVTRIFGGTKLGVGGLIRAYGGAARELLDTAKIVEIVPFVVATVNAPYELSGAIAAVQTSFGLEPVESTFGEAVRQVFHVPLADVDAFVEALTDRTAGKAAIEISEPDAG